LKVLVVKCGSVDGGITTVLNFSMFVNMPRGRGREGGRVDRVSSDLD